MSLVNEYRADARVGPVALHAVIDEIAVKRANQLASARKLSHDLDYVKKRLAAAGICWQRLGEIIAYNGSRESERVKRFVAQWHGSDGHRAIMLGPDYTHAGGSWTTASNGYHYAAMVFVKLCNAPAQRVDSATPFTDIAGNKFANDIVWAYEQGLLGGCTATKFCPTSKLRRGELAGALAAGLNLPPTDKKYFSDIAGHPFEDAINRLRAAGLTTGCGGGKFCPGYAMLRGTLARDLAYAFRLGPTQLNFYSDIAGHRHQDAINRIAAARKTVGCGGGTFCPDYRVARQLAALWLRRVFN